MHWNDKYGHVYRSSHECFANWPHRGAAALGAGAKDNGGPGVRADYHDAYDAAFVRAVTAPCTSAVPRSPLASAHVIGAGAEQQQIEKLGDRPPAVASTRVDAAISERVEVENERELEVLA